MSSPARFSRKVCFGEFELNVETAELRNNGNKAILPGKPFQILITLLDRPGELVTREELKTRLWPSDTFVDFDQSLNKAVNRLREALEDSAEHPRFIETLPRRGYRFIHSVQTGSLRTGVEDGADEPVPIDKLLPIESTADHALDQRLISDRGESPVAHPHGGRYIAAAIITVVAVAIVVFAIFRWRSHPEKLDLADWKITKLTDSGRARDVAISPDGLYVVYALSDGELESLRLRQVATQSDVEILPSGARISRADVFTRWQLHLRCPLRFKRPLL